METIEDTDPRSDKEVEKDMMTGLFRELASEQAHKAPQPTFAQDGATTMCRFDPGHMLTIVKSLQADADRALDWAEKEQDRTSPGIEFATHYAAQRRVLCRQMMLHFSNALCDYEPENEDSAHAPPPDILAQFGLRDAL